MIFEHHPLQDFVLELYQGRWETLLAYGLTLGYLLVLGLGLALAYTAGRAWLSLEGRPGRPLATGVLALRQTLGGLWGGLGEIARLPAGGRRVWAVARLSFKEAIRRRILYVFVLFLAPFLFAGWYLPNNPEGHLVFLVAFVNNAMTWLLLPLVIFIASMSLPGDIQHQTIHTIVTKPVYRLEILVGRIAGYMGIFTGVLLVMGVVSLLYLRGQVSADVHRTQWTARVPIYASPPGLDKSPLLFFKNGEYKSKEQGGGTNVGQEWDYRSHIEGATTDAAHWFFQFDPDGFVSRESVPVQFTFNIFKTTKGKPKRTEDEGSGVWCQLEFRERLPQAIQEIVAEAQRAAPTGIDQAALLEASGRVRAAAPPDRSHPDDEWLAAFFARLDEDADGRLAPDRQRRDHGGEPEELPHRSTSHTFSVDNSRLMSLDVPPSVFRTGHVEVIARCLTPFQFLGMATWDLYFLDQERGFEANFLKGLLGLWLKVLLVTCVAVSASTVLKGFVTVLLTSAVYVLGFYYDFLHRLLFDPTYKGGGPLESLIRLHTHANMVSPLEPTLVVRLSLEIDRYLLGVLRAISHVVPNLTTIDSAQFVASGFDIPGIVMLGNVLVVLGYVVPVVLIGFFLFRAREIAA